MLSIDGTKLVMEPVDLAKVPFVASAGSINPKTGERKEPKLALATGYRGGYQLIGSVNDVPVKVSLSIAIPVDLASAVNGKKAKR